MAQQPLAEAAADAVDSVEPQPTRKIRPLAQLAPFLQPYKTRVILALIALIGAASATLVLPVAIRYMIDLGFSSDTAEHIDRYFIMLFAVVLVLSLATAARYYMVTWLGERVVADIRSAVFKHMLAMSPTFFDTTRTGEVLSRLTTDTTLIQSIIGSTVSIALRNILLLVGGFTMLIVTSPKLVGMMLILIPLIVIPIIGFGRMVRRLSRLSQDRVADSSIMADETLHAITTVQAFTAESLETARFDQTVEASFQTALRRIQARAALTAIVILLIFGAMELVLWSGAQNVISGDMTAGRLGQFIMYAVFVGGAAGALSEVWGELQRAAGATERLVELMHAEPDIAVPVKPQSLPTAPTGEVVFDDVSFTYPSRPQDPALQNFSLTIKPGETVALVGPSGAGKSTVFQLLLRFYDPQAGAIRFENLDIRQVDPSQLRKSIGLVPQQSVVFANDAAANIRYGKPDASDDEVQAAAKFAAAHDFISRLPDGYATDLGERGLRLSGGQQQRIAIARAFLKHPAVMLLDEATSALDAESEQLVQEALEHLLGEQTTLVIAHRLATVKQADRIVVMDEGRIVASGTHDELLAQDGLYARLARLQFHA